MNDKQNQTAVNRPPATSERECRKCGGFFLGDEHHQFCGICVVVVAREIARMQS